MKCPTCGAWSVVKRTTGDERRRECANLHRFTTREVAIEEEKATKAQRAEERRRAIAAAPGRAVDVAEQFHCDESTVRALRKKYREADAAAR